MSKCVGLSIKFGSNTLKLPFVSFANKYWGNHLFSWSSSSAIYILKQKDENVVKL